jgi:hypothetical protein
MNEAVPPHQDEVVSESGGRLESWKEIAAYLRRGVRTVQRWERTESLPVHRHHHDKRGTVYAFRDEIDTWLEDRKEAAAPAVEDDRLSASAGHRRAFDAIVEWMSAALQRIIPAYRKKRLSVRMTGWILLLLI